MHGYEIAQTYTQKSGEQKNLGNFYRELSKLDRGEYVIRRDNATDDDQRRILYQITEKGIVEFDRWLKSPSSSEEELRYWLIFVDRFTPDQLDPLLDRLLQQLWLTSKRLALDRENSLVCHTPGNQNGNSKTFNPEPTLLLLRMKQVSAVIEVIEELRRDLAGSAVKGA